MKRIIISIMMVTVSIMTAFAQEEKPESTKPASEEISALRTAAALAKYGYANYSALALIDAANIFSAIRTQELEAARTSGSNGTINTKENNVSFDPAQLLADAKSFAGKDKTILALIKKSEQGLYQTISRGAVGGPKGGVYQVRAKDTDVFKIKFWSSELAEVCVSGDGDTDLDLYIYDENGNLIGSDSDYTDDCVVRWVPAWTGTFIIKVVNRGVVYNEYALWTN